VSTLHIAMFNIRNLADRWAECPGLIFAGPLAWDRPAVDDPTLYPTDHLGLTARLEIGA
jgi:hypothetical protein